MGRKHRTKHEMMYDFNKILLEQGCKHTIIDVKSHSHIKFSNGFTINNKSEVNRFIDIFNKYKLNWFPSLSWWFDFPVSHEKRDSFLKYIKIKNGGIGGKSAWDTEEKRQKNSNAMKGKTPWNKGIKTNKPSWIAGKNKYNCDIIREKFSENRLGDNNPMRKRGGFSEKEKKEQSERVKKLILDGKFTPKSNNRLTKMDSVVFDKKFRSSWEAAFWYKNQHMLYEKVRIKYMSELGKERIYITDFVDGNTLYEIGPKCKIPDKLLKQQASLENGFEFHFITENEIINIISEFSDEDWSNFSETTSNRLKKLL